MSDEKPAVATKSPYFPPAKRLSSLPAEVTLECSVCGTKRHDNFSNRQLNKAQFGESHRCIKCIEAAGTPSPTSNHHGGGGVASVAATSGTTAAAVAVTTSKRARKGDDDSHDATISAKLFTEDTTGPKGGDDINDKAKGKDNSNRVVHNRNGATNDEEDDKSAGVAMQKIPRKKRAPEKHIDSSPIGVQRPKTKRQKMVDRQKSIFDDDDEDDDNEEQDCSGSNGIDDGNNVNVEALKLSILGRKMNTSHDRSDLDDYHNQLNGKNNNNNNNNNTTSIFERNPEKAPPAQTLEGLQRDLTCPICYEVFLDPVSLPCGHTYCHDCLGWWGSASQQQQQRYLQLQQRPRCPTCRSRTVYWVSSVTTGALDRRVNPEKELGINMALRACVLALFPQQLQARLNIRAKAVGGEIGGFHQEGYKILTPLEESASRWVRCADSQQSLQVQRSIVMDADDQRMQLALAVHGLVHLPSKENRSTTEDEEVLRVQLCLLHLEEDEAEDGGIPFSIRDGDDDEYFIAQSDQASYTRSFVDASTVAPNGDKEPLLRRQMGANGMVGFFISLAGLGGSSAISFHHEETGLELVLQLPHDQEIQKRSQNGISERRSEDLFGGSDLARNRFVYRDEDEEDEDGDNKDYIRDGFVVDDVDEPDDDDDEVSYRSEEEDNDACCLCHNVGELLICDGGGHMEGCSKSFHLSCVGLDAVPEGDWVCDSCASAAGLETDSGGFEFPPTGNDTDKEEKDDNDDGEDNNDSGMEGRFSSDENNDQARTLGDTDSEDEEGITRQRSKPRPPKKRHVLEDSDEDD